MSLHRSVPTGEAAGRRALFEAEARHSTNAVDLAGAVIAQINEAVDTVAGARVAGAVGFATLTRMSQKKASHTDWPKLLDSLCDADIAHGGIGLILHRMRAYAYYGIALCGDRTADERHSFIQHLMLCDAEYVRERARGDDLWWTGIEDMLSAAQGRWFLDHAEPIHPGELANLAGLSERQIRKMMWQPGTPFTGIRNLIPAELALTWLLDRTEEFYPSIWVSQDAFTDLPCFCKAQS